MPVMTGHVPVRDAYDVWAATYGSCENRTRDADAALLQAADLPLAGAQVVEIGAGTDKNTTYLSAHAAQVMALDLSGAMLAKARRRGLGRHVALVEHDITLPWPISDAAADLVVGNLVLEHVARLEPVFAEARRVLRPGGLFYLAEIHPYRQWRGSGARFQTPDGEVRVEVHVHSIADYVTAGLAAGLVLRGGTGGVGCVRRDVNDGLRGCASSATPAAADVRRTACVNGCRLGRSRGVAASLLPSCDAAAVMDRRAAPRLTADAALK